MFKFATGSTQTTIGAHSYTTTNFKLPVDEGYLAIALKSWNISGIAEANCFACASTTDGTVQINIQNPTSNQITVGIHIDLLLVKKEFVEF